MSVQVPKGYKQTEVGVIPSDWSLNRLVDLAEIRSGIAKNANANITNPVSVYYLRVANVQDGFLDLSEMSQLLVSRDDIKRYAVMPNDMLMNEGGDLDKLGRGALWNGEFSPCIHQNHVFVVRCGKFLLPTYLKAWTGSTAARRYFLLAGRQTTNLASINKTSLGQLPIPLPPNQAEQQAIAEALSDADALIESLEQLIAKKRQIKQGAMQELLTGQRRLPGFSGAWVRKKLPEIAWFQEGPGVRVWQFTRSGIKLLNGTNIFNGSLYLEATNRFISENEAYGVYSHFLADVDDIVIASSGISIDRFHEKVAVVKEQDLPFCMNTSTIRFKANEKLITKDYLFHLLRGDELKKYLGGQATGSAQLNFGPSHLNKFEVLLPDMAEQHAIAEFLSDLDSEIESLDKQLAKARQIKQAMMQELLTGRIRLI